MSTTLLAKQQEASDYFHHTAACCAYELQRRVERPEDESGLGHTYVKAFKKAEDFFNLIHDRSRRTELMASKLCAALDNLDNEQDFLDSAEKLGWSFEEDDAHQSYCLHATPQECFMHAMLRMVEEGIIYSDWDKSVS